MPHISNITEGATPGLLKITMICPFCHTPQEVQVTEEGFRRFQGGANVQDAFPLLTPGQRELFVSGICPTCWDSMPKDED